MNRTRKSDIMKKTIVLAVCSLAFVAGITARASAQGRDEGRNTVVTVACTPETENIANQWCEAFNTSGFKGAETRVTPSAVMPEEGVLIGTDNDLNTATGWKMVIGRNIIVPVIGTGNENYDDIAAKGVSRTEFIELNSASSRHEWNDITGNGSTKPVRCIVTDDKAVTQSLSRFLGIPASDIEFTVVKSSSELLGVIRNDNSAIGFCSVTDITDTNTRQFVGGVSIIPVDINENGRSDYFEQFYSDYASFSRGVYIGKYPRALYENIYLTAGSEPSDAATASFVRFLISGGQEMLAVNGVAPLASGEIQSRLAALNESAVTVTGASSGPPVFRAFLWLLVAGIVLVSAGYLIYRVVKSGSGVYQTIESVHNISFSEKSLDVPGGILFDKTHTWAYMEKNGLVRVGVDDFLQHITGTITRVILKKNGEKVRKGEQLLSLVQNGKHLNIYSPVTGTVTEFNSAIGNNSSKINKSPFSEGWIYLITPDNWLRETGFMVMADQYTEWIRKEFARLKDFLALSLRSDDRQYSMVVLQDGGEIKEGLLEDFGPEFWEDFQTRFIDPSKI